MSGHRKKITVATRTIWLPTSTLLMASLLRAADTFDIRWIVVQKEAPALPLVVHLLELLRLKCRSVVIDHQEHPGIGGALYDLLSALHDFEFEHGEYVLFIDDDVHFDTQTLEVIVGHFSQIHPEHVRGIATTSDFGPIDEMIIECSTRLGIPEALFTILDWKTLLDIPLPDWEPLIRMDGCAEPLFFGKVLKMQKGNVDVVHYPGVNHVWVPNEHRTWSELILGRWWQYYELASFLDTYESVVQFCDLLTDINELEQAGLSQGFGVSRSSQVQKE